MAFCAPPAYLTHRQKVLRLYKRALRHLESWCVHRDKYRYFACLMRARFEEHKNEKDMMKATQLLRQAEEEFWQNQHPQPYIFPDSPGGTSYERYECYKVPEWCLDYWHPSEKAVYPDYFSKREQWKKLRMESWDREVKQLEEETSPDGIMTEALPPARKEGDLPPLWWHIVTRPRERPT